MIHQPAHLAGVMDQLKSVELVHDMLGGATVGDEVVATTLPERQTAAIEVDRHRSWIRRDVDGLVGQAGPREQLARERSVGHARELVWSVGRGAEVRQQAVQGFRIISAEQFRSADVEHLGARPDTVVARPLAHHVEQARIESHRLPLLSPGA